MARLVGFLVPVLSVVCADATAASAVAVSRSSAGNRVGGWLLAGGSVLHALDVVKQLAVLSLSCQVTLAQHTCWESGYGVPL